MLFQNFSWQDFLLAAALLSVLWYVLLWLFLFRGRPSVLGAPANGGARGADVFDGIEENLLGRPVMAEGEKVVGADDFGFAGADQLEQLGVVADVQEQLRVTCRELESRLAAKEEFLSVISSVLKCYPVPLSSRLPLEEFIREHLPFFVTEDEMDGLWG
ncbi:hypothetical protein [Pedobacter sp.]